MNLVHLRIKMIIIWENNHLWLYHLWLVIVCCFLDLVMFWNCETFPSFKIFVHVLFLYDRILIVEEWYLNENVCTFLRKLCKFPRLESRASGWQSCSEMWLHWPGHPCDTIFWNDHSRKVNYSFQFCLGKLTTEEAFSVLTGNTIITLVFMYAVAPFTLGVRIHFLIPNKGIGGLAYHFSSITIFIWKIMKLLYVFAYVFLKTI